MEVSVTTPTTQMRKPSLRKSESQQATQFLIAQSGQQSGTMRPPTPSLSSVPREVTRKGSVDEKGTTQHHRGHSGLFRGFFQLC